MFGFLMNGATPAKTTGSNAAKTAMKFWNFEWAARVGDGVTTVPVAVVTEAGLDGGRVIVCIMFILLDGPSVVCPSANLDRKRLAPPSTLLMSRSERERN